MELLSEPNWPSGGEMPSIPLSLSMQNKGQTQLQSTLAALSHLGAGVGDRGAPTGTGTQNEWPDHKTRRHFPLPPTHTPYNLITMSLFIRVPFTKYILTSFQEKSQSLWKGKKHSIKKQDQDQNQTLIWQRIIKVRIWNNND